jgi:hypothetical protein
MGRSFIIARDAKSGNNDLIEETGTREVEA